MSTKLKFPEIILTGLIILRIGITMIPSLSISSNTILNFSSLLLLYLFAIIGRRMPFNTLLTVCTLISISILDVFANFSSVSSAVAYLYIALQNAIWPVLGISLLYRPSIKQAKTVLSFLIIILVFVGFHTYTGCIEYPLASRLLATGLSEDQETFHLFKRLNIGDFRYVYTLTLFVPVLLFLLHKSIIEKVLSIVAYSAIVAIALVTEYTTALLMCVFPLCVLFIPSNFKIWQVVFGIFIFLIILVVGFSVVDLFLVHIDSDIVSERLINISDILSGKQIERGSDSYERMIAWEKSLESFSSSPLWGTRMIGGGHSFIFDNMSKYGLIGLVAMIVVFKKQFSVFFSPFLNTDFGRYLLIIYIMNIFLSFANPLNNDFFICFIIPLILVALRNENIYARQV